jgi:hypothetical protein
VLVTEANWKAPIGDFHMVIDKGAPANLVSFCGTGVRKTGPHFRGPLHQFHADQQCVGADPESQLAFPLNMI